MKVVGHRGWPTRYPDNVIEGIAAALEVADMVEVDVRSSGDGQLILSHDPAIGDRPVASTPWAELAPMDVGRGFHPARLEDLLDRFPTSPFNLEVKNLPGDPGFDPGHGLALEVAARARPGDLLTCFYWPSVDAVRVEFPDVATGLLVDSGWDVAGAVDHALAKGHVGIMVQWEFALESGPACLVAHEAGLAVGVWTLNDPSLVGELASIGVTAIITDDPGELRRVLG